MSRRFPSALICVHLRLPSGWNLRRAVKQTRSEQLPVQRNLSLRGRIPMLRLLKVMRDKAPHKPGCSLFNTTVVPEKKRYGLVFR